LEKKIYNELRTHKVARKKRRDQTIDPSVEDQPDSSFGVQREGLKDFTLEEVKELLIQDNIARKFRGVIGQGKEANVYWIRDAKKREAALKMFRIHTSSHNLKSYHARSKLSDTAKLNITSRFCLTEYLNLYTLYEAGVRVPKPYDQYEFYYSMQFLGSKRGVSPLLLDVNLEDAELEIVEMMDDILEQLDIMFNKAMIVYGDFSEHNIIFHNDKLWVIDFLQSQKYHPRYATEGKINKKDALPILRRDIDNILIYFKKNYRMSYDPVVVFGSIIGDDPDWIPQELMSENFDLDKYLIEEKRMRYE
ncbi:MAG: RIO1 family regulatory kinase/ATPase, partial [Candidatus Heimdallarchaeota archaeon]